MAPSLAKPKEKDKRAPLPQAVLPALLLDWYDIHRRAMPWRAVAGQAPDPYHVWLSEIMLQQTTVVTVGPYFLKFIRKWPSLAALAAAPLDEVLQMWAGLGYYRRARNLHACASVLVGDYGGKFPQTEKELLALPGVGPYTAAAIAAIAFGQKANVVDGNVERVMARLYVVNQPLPQAKPRLKQLAAALLPQARCGDYAQALMDLGATVCSPRSPKCEVCPWALFCTAKAKGQAEAYPARAPAKAKLRRYGFAFVVFDKKREKILLRQRFETGLLAGMMEVPSTPWQEGEPLSWAKARKFAPLKAEWQNISVAVHHTFTHFELELELVVACLSCADDKKSVQGRWVALTQLDREALPSVMRKVIVAAQNAVRLEKRGAF